MYTNNLASQNAGEGENPSSGTGEQFAPIVHPLPFDRQRWMTRKQVAAYLKVSTSTVDNWSRCGKLIPHKDGRFVRFDRCAIDDRMHELMRYRPIRKRRSNSKSNLKTPIQ